MDIYNILNNLGWDIIKFETAILDIITLIIKVFVAIINFILNNFLVSILFVIASPFIFIMLIEMIFIFKAMWNKEEELPLINFFYYNQGLAVFIYNMLKESLEMSQKLLSILHL